MKFRSERDGKAFDVAVPICSSQLAGRQALVTAALPAVPRRIGVWSATWRLGDAVLATQKVRAISQAAFQRSLTFATFSAASVPAADRAAVRAEQFAAAARGELLVVVQDVLPLDRAADAHRALDAGTVFGRLVLTP